MKGVNFFSVHTLQMLHNITQWFFFARDSLQEKSLIEINKITPLPLVVCFGCLFLLFLLLLLMLLPLLLFLVCYCCSCCCFTLVVCRGHSATRMGHPTIATSTVVFSFILVLRIRDHCFYLKYTYLVLFWVVGFLVQGIHLWR